MPNADVAGVRPVDIHAHFFPQPYLDVEREREILKMRYGFEDGSEYTLEEIGRKFMLTRERIRQIEKEALGKLRSSASAGVLKKYSSVQ